MTTNEKLGELIQQNADVENAVELIVKMIRRRMENTGESLDESVEHLRNYLAN